MQVFTEQLTISVSFFFSCFLVAVLSASVAMTYTGAGPEFDTTGLEWFVRIGSLIALSIIGLSVLVFVAVVPLYYYYRAHTNNFLLFRIRAPVNQSSSTPERQDLRLPK